MGPRHAQHAEGAPQGDARAVEVAEGDAGRGRVHRAARLPGGVQELSGRGGLGGVLQARRRRRRRGLAEGRSEVREGRSREASLTSFV